MPDSDDRDDEEPARARARALLEATHRFPCEYLLTVIALNDDSITERLVAAINTAAAEPIEVEGAHLNRRPSATGKYLSHKFFLRVSEAAEVLRLYEVVKAVEGVVTLM